MKAILREEAWRERTVRRLHGKVQTFSRFEEFVATPPLEGLGSGVEQIRKLLRDDTEALDLLDRATVARPGNPRPSGSNQHTRKAAEPVQAGMVIDNDVMNYHPEKPGRQGNGRQYVLRRLRTARPDLHAAVLAGELSPHRAMVAAGFRRRTLSLPVEGPQAMAGRLIQPSAACCTRRRGAGTRVPGGATCWPCHIHGPLYPGRPICAGRPPNCLACDTSLIRL